MCEFDQNEDTISVYSDELEHCLTETGRQQDTWGKFVCCVARKLDLSAKQKNKNNENPTRPAILPVFTHVWIESLTLVIDVGRYAASSAGKITFSMFSKIFYRRLSGGCSVD